MIRVLQSSEQITEARERLRAEGLDTSRGWRRAMYALRWRLRFRFAPEPVAVQKSWDVWTMYQTILARMPGRAARVFEMGSYNSEIPLVLWCVRYHNIRASDFNPLGRSIRWYGNRIDFRCEDFYAPDLPPESVDVMTALSVIEHGFDQERLIGTASRLLKPGGLFLFTTDYREEGAIVPETVRPFGLSYRVFSRSDIEALLDAATAVGLDLISAPEWAPSTYPIEWEGFQFTFLFVGLQKRQ